MAIRIVLIVAWLLVGLLVTPALTRLPEYLFDAASGGLQAWCWFDIFGKGGAGYRSRRVARGFACGGGCAQGERPLPFRPVPAGTGARTANPILQKGGGGAVAEENDHKPQKFTQAWLEEIIQEAMRKGEFDNLPGKGKPLDLEKDEPDPYAAGEGSWIVNRILRENKVAPLWIELEKAIREDREWLATHPKDHPERQERIRELNEKIMLYNLNKPRGILDKLRYRD
ncbi:hypothetical protein J2Z79_002376 [Symbiobacterium terraclitae]|uniref:DnaJ homologue subfamily C member 28 conserved domain-containing protein n=1 Tax=Symbiobacterium terraclitae TaxID=557451 RepID=A0ABS4JVI6_9FIRM|nr:DUF1992 domain-containing protein [Symbiobacterium terraclitae]MBP2018960.1 hypothetical protein [Symbiobacterium terraclitae]